MENYLTTSVMLAMLSNNVWAIPASLVTISLLHHKTGALDV